MTLRRMGCCTAISCAPRWGDHYNEEDAVVIDTHGPNEPQEFITTFGLNQPGAAVAFKVFVILNTDNEVGSATLLVERPLAIPIAA